MPVVKSAEQIARETREHDKRRDRERAEQDTARTQLQVESINEMGDRLADQLDALTAAVGNVEQAARDLADATSNVETAVRNMDRATTTLMWVSIGVAGVAIVVAVLLAVL